MDSFKVNPIETSIFTNLGPFRVRAAVGDVLEKLAGDSGVSPQDIIRQMIDYALASMQDGAK